MYEIKLNSGKTFDVMDYYEIIKTIDAMKAERDEFYGIMSKEVEKFFNQIKKMNKTEEELKEYIFKNIIRGQLLTNESINYLINGKKEFHEYFEKIIIEDVILETHYNTLKEGNFGKKEATLSFVPSEVQKVFDNYNLMESYYYLVFTLTFLEKYLVNLFILQKENFKPKLYKNEDIGYLYAYLTNVFSQDFGLVFKIFEEEMVTY